MGTSVVMLSKYYWNVGSELGLGFDCPTRRAIQHLQKMPIAKGGSLEVLATDVLDSSDVNALLDGCTI